MERLVRIDLQESIILQIKKYILTNRLQPGDALPSQQSMAKSLGASRTAVREAVKTLEALNFVRVVNGKGIFVEQIDRSLFDAETDIAYYLTVLIESLQVRKVLEALAIELATEKATQAELEELSAILSEVESRFSLGEPQSEFDFKFHRRILELSGNRLLIHTTDSLISKSSGLWNLPGKIAVIFTRSVGEHRSVMDFMLRRDSAGAVRAHYRYMDRMLAELSALRHMGNSSGSGLLMAQSGILQEEV